jgi:hypothetical protein
MTQWEKPADFDGLTLAALQATAALTAFYAQHNPAKLCEVDAAITCYAASFDTLFNRLEEKYGVAVHWR